MTADMETLERWLTADGSPYALEDAQIGGRKHRAFRHGPRTLSDIYRKVQARPDNALLVVGGRPLICRMVMDDAARLSAVLREQFAVGPGIRVGIALNNRYEAVTAFLAVTLLNGTAVLIGGHDTRRTQYCSDIAACDVLISEARNIPIDSSSPSDLWIGSRTDAKYEFSYWKPFSDTLCATEIPRLPVPTADPESDAVITFTSGTTGLPKGVTLTHRSIVTGLMNMMLAGSLANAGQQRRAGAKPTAPLRSCALLFAPFTHVSGYTQLLLQMMVGGKLVLGDDWPVRAIAETIEKEKVRSVIGLTPAKTRALLDVASEYDLSSLAAFHINGFALHQNLAEAIVAKLPQVTVGTSYGMTETSGAICALAGNNLRERPHSSGRVVPTAEIKIVADDGQELQTGEPGEIWVRGAMLFRGYCGGGADALREGWFRTGDLGSVSEDRYLTVLDRLQDTLAVNGSTVSCLSVERAVMELPDVEEVAVFALDGGDAGTSLAVAVVPRQNARLDLATIRARVLETVGLEPKLAVLGELPRNSSGKINGWEIKRLHFVSDEDGACILA